MIRETCRLWVGGCGHDLAKSGAQWHGWPDKLKLPIWKPRQFELQLWKQSKQQQAELQRRLERNFCGSDQSYWLRIWWGTRFWILFCFASEISTKEAQSLESNFRKVPAKTAKTDDAINALKESRDTGTFKFLDAHAPGLRASRSESTPWTRTSSCWQRPWHKIGSSDVASSNPTRTAGCVCMLAAPLWCDLTDLGCCSKTVVVLKLRRAPPLTQTQRWRRQGPPADARRCAARQTDLEHLDSEPESASRQVQVSPSYHSSTGQDQGPAPGAGRRHWALAWT